jgi:TrmH family RNA methyltransferase
MKNLPNISIILVNTETPENIGSVARCMKNMGLKELLLVNPVPYKRIETYSLGYRSREIIDKAKVYNDLQEALKPFNFIIGTTQRLRGRNLPLYTPQEAITEISTIGPQKKVALVFGRESKGLTNQELRFCHIVSTIPTALRQPSLNLAQAVMLYCYEFFKVKLNKEKIDIFKLDLAENNEISILYEHLRSCLQSVNFHPRGDMEDFIDCFRRILGRVKLEKRDVKLFHKLFSEIEWAIKNACKGEGESYKINEP